MACGLLSIAASAHGSAAHVFGDPAVSQRAPQRTYHVLNYKLSLHFDQAKGEVAGSEDVLLRPLTTGFNHFDLDSSELTIERVTLQGANGRSVPLSFEAAAQRLRIALDRSYARGEAVRVRIRYHGFPRAGLYFVTPNRDYPHWPSEIWSQGEPEFNHFWFPCWDHPNDMSTSETVLTVPEGEVAVSNGRLVTVTHRAGEVTYDWVESIPHSSYLTSIAIGPWRRISDHAGKLPVDYYVAPGVSEMTARRSFHLTPDMITFFSRAVGVPYPYEKYDQVVMVNYVFGGMENVSVTTLTDATLHSARAEPDYPSQGLVAHELGQHWFGDLVQGRDWADIWLNEGFATYMEALYTQFHEGNDAFRVEMMDDQQSAQRQDREDYVRPIVDDHYRYPLQMFDSITHEKGAAVLDMLRNVLDGSSAAAHPASQDEMFFRALRAYLTTYRAQAVDTGDLLTILQRTTGQDLRWFFDEWVYNAGCPHYLVTASYDAGTKLERVKIVQTQDTAGVPRTFVMPIELDFYGAGGESKHVRIQNRVRSQEFQIPLAFRPQWVDFDPSDVIEKELSFVQPLNALIAKSRRDPAAMSRLAAVADLAQIEGTGVGAAVTALTRALNRDPFFAVRAAAASSLAQLHTESAKAALLKAIAQPDSRVRVAVVKGLASFTKDPSVYRALTAALSDDQSFAVQAAAAAGLGPDGDLGAFRVLSRAAMSRDEVHVVQGVFEGLITTADPRAFPILLADARPGVPERLRLEALEALAGARGFAPAAKMSEVAAAVRGALRDPTLFIRQAGEALAGSYGLTAFAGQIETIARTAATEFERAAATAALQQLRAHSTASRTVSSAPDTRSGR
ncbi:MAG TPA: M1 family metallopeptidase [Steroidobacteraceae bacterium]|nr:M1 family metallopeptidase [Steroidobacteraceae bacterium]